MAALVLDTKSSPWLQEKLKPKLTGDLKISVRFASGQLSTFAVPSTMTVGEFKATIGKAAIMDELDDSSSRAHSRTLLYLGKALDDAATLEQCEVADRSCLQEQWCAPDSKEAIAKANRETLAAVQAAAHNYGSHAEALHARVKHYEPKRLDTDFTAPSWLTDYKPYGIYVPPRDGAAQIQAPAYEAATK